MELRQESALLSWLAPSSLTPGNAWMSPIQSTPKPQPGYIRVTAVRRLAGISFLLARPRSIGWRAGSIFFPGGKNEEPAAIQGPAKPGGRMYQFPCCCNKSSPTSLFVFSSCTGQKSGTVWLSLGSHKAKVKVSIGLGSYADVLGEVHLQDHSGCWQNPVPRWMSAWSLSQLLRATPTSFVRVLPPPSMARAAEFFSCFECL